MSEPKNYYVRMSEASDIDKILEFYKINKHHNVRDRDADILRERADRSPQVIGWFGWASER